MAPLIKVLPDIEIFLVNWLPAPLSAYLAAMTPPVNVEPRVAQSLPEQITQTIVRVTRAAGAARNYFVDRPIVDIDVFSPDFDQSALVARVCAYLMNTLRGIATQYGTVQSVDVILGPHWLPEANQNLTRYSGSYEIHCHA